MNSRNIIGRNPSMVIPLLANQDLTPMLVASLHKQLLSLFKITQDDQSTNTRVLSVYNKTCHSKYSNTLIYLSFLSLLNFERNCQKRKATKWGVCVKFNRFLLLTILQFFECPCLELSTIKQGSRVCGIICFKTGCWLCSFPIQGRKYRGV